jgi:hypothetical protein
VNAYDSLVATYWEPTTEYKRDKLIRMTRQLRKLFKDLRPEVLEEIDLALNQNRGNVQAEDWQAGGYQRDSREEVSDSHQANTHRNDNPPHSHERETDNHQTDIPQTDLYNDTQYNHSTQDNERTHRTKKRNSDEPEEI